jgi:hypothetical protein
MIIGTKISAQNKECDYITSRYHHKVAQAELCWLDEKEEESYNILSEYSFEDQIIDYYELIYKKS